MAEYIERERLKEAFNADLQTLQTLDEHTMDLILIEIDEAPVADVAEVRHGRWVNTNKEVEQMCKCSECGYPVSYFWSRTPYCPNCGALMREDDNGKE